MTYTLYRNFFGSWFGKAKSIEISAAGLTLVDVNQNTKEISVNQLIDFPIIEQSLFGKTLVFKSKSKSKAKEEVSRIWGISASSAKLFDNAVKLGLNKSIASNITRQIDYFHQEAITQYLRDSSVDTLHESVTPLIQSYKTAKTRWRNILSKQQLAKMDVIARMPAIKDAQSFRQYYESKVLADQADFFDGIEANPLTKEQRLAVIRNNDRNLILAAAGTGKTSVMVAKALNLISHGKVPAEKVLILAYNNAAAKELKERLAARKKAFGLTCQSPTIITFHALGLKILTAAKASTSLSAFAEEPMQLENWFSHWLLAHISQSPDAMQRFIDLAYQPNDLFEFNSQAEYEAHIRDNEYQTLQGEQVKSYQELLIANWLFLNSVAYQYQGQYVSKRRLTAGVDYKPSFHILNTDTNLYLEHFDVARDGSTPVGSDASQYNEQMLAIRALHQECKTKLIETYHYDFVEGNFASQLTSLMADCEIKLAPKSPSDILAALKETGLLAENIKRYIKCLQAIRVEQLNSEQVTTRLANAEIKNAKQYAGLLNDINQAYAGELKSQGEIDFDDMISNAFEHLVAGDFVPQWTDILVDEFQDISAARMNLLNELIAKGPRPRLTVVGDDWQSIYRFAGAKLELITQFEKYSGSHSLTTLQKTFRYNNSIAKTAGQFVMQNPEQYTKHIEAHHQVEQSQVYLLDSDKNAIDARIAQVVNSIKAQDPTGSIAILARYRYLLNNAKAELSRVSENNNIHYWTFHGSKGLEADYCIIVGFFRGKTGFPNENKEHAVVEALLPLVDGFKNSEERRLLYVAITRAKKKAYLIADALAPSEFIEELLSPSYDLNILSNKFNKSAREILKCPACQRGYFSKYSGKHGDFYSCTSKGACQVKPRVCVQCSSPSVDGESTSRCQNPKCQATIKICLKCGRPMKLRKGQYGDFWGCSGYAIKSDQCCHTEKADLAV